MKIVYAGSPAFAVAPLRALLEAGKEVVAVITQPDKPVGRKRIITPTAVKAYAQEKNIPVYDFVRLRDHTEEIASLGADLMITCAYGQLLTQEILDAFPVGVYNLHASLLPAFRGASPIQSAILAGCEETGVTVMRTELSLDSGAVLLSKRVGIGNKTCAQLSGELSSLSAQAVLEAVELLEGGNYTLIPQAESAATFCKKIGKEDARVRFDKPAAEVARLINAMNPSPVAYCNLAGSAVNLYCATPCEGEGECGKVISADKNGIVIACNGGAVRVTQLQFAGGKVTDARDAVNGRKVKVGDRFD